MSKQKHDRGYQKRLLAKEKKQESKQPEDGNHWARMLVARGLASPGILHQPLMRRRRHDKSES